MNRDMLAKSLGIENTVPSTVAKKNTATTAVTVPAPVVEDEPEPAYTKDAAEDYTKVREVMNTLLDEGLTAVRDARQIAASNELPESFSAVANLIKAVTAASEKLYDVHAKTKTLKEIPNSKVAGKKVMDNGQVNIDKAVFIGSPADLLDQYKEDDE